MKGLNFLCYVTGAGVLMALLIIFANWLKEFIDDALWRRDRRRRG